jgi:peptidyl-prolyl cis-trans isomerase D
MFNLFRSREKSVRILLGALLLLICASMLYYFIPQGPGFGGDISGTSTIAAVDGEKITDVDVQRQIAMVTRGQTNLPKGILAMYIPQIVNQLLEEKAMAYKAKEMGLKVSDKELADNIEAEFAPQMGGTFNLQTYQQALAQEGLTPADFEKQQRESMLASRLENLERQSMVISDADARTEYQRKNLKVGLQYISFNLSQFMSKVTSDPAAVKAYFDQNRSLFRDPELRSYDVIMGTSADFMQSAQVSESQLQKDYQEEIDSFRTPERVRVRHILIKTQGKPKADVPLLRAKAEAILKQLQNGGDFAALAKKNSEDNAPGGSAEKGGELGWVIHGQMVPNFEKAAFSLKPGELSGIVDTEYGFHIVQAEEKQAAHTQTFEEARPQLLLDAKKQVASDAFHRNVEAAHSEILANPSQAQAIAAKYNLKYIKEQNVAAGVPPPDLAGANTLVQGVSSAVKGAVTEVYPLDNDTKAAFAVVLNITPAHNAEFNEVQSQVVQKFTSAEAQRLAQEAAKQAAESARKGESLEAIAKRLGGTLKTAAPFSIDGAAEGIGPATQLAAAFKANVGDVIGPISTAAGQFVCKVSEKVPADMNQYAASKAAIVQGLEQDRLRVQQPLFRDSVLEDLKRRKKVQINQAAIDHIVERFQG